MKTETRMEYNTQIIISSPMIHHISNQIRNFQPKGGFIDFKTYYCIQPETPVTAFHVYIKDIKNMLQKRSTLKESVLLLKLSNPHQLLLQFPQTPK